MICKKKVFQTNKAWYSLIQKINQSLAENLQRNGTSMKCIFFHSWVILWSTMCFVNTCLNVRSDESITSEFLLLQIQLFSSSRQWETFSEMTHVLGCSWIFMMWNLFFPGQHFVWQEVAKELCLANVCLVWVHSGHYKNTWTMYSHVNARASLESALLRYADLRRAVGEALGETSMSRVALLQVLLPGNALKICWLLLFRWVRKEI